MDRLLFVMVLFTSTVNLISFVLSLLFLFYLLFLIIIKKKLYLKFTSLKSIWFSTQDTWILIVLSLKMQVQCNKRSLL